MPLQNLLDAKTIASFKSKGGFFLTEKPLLKWVGKWSYSYAKKYEFLIWILAQMFKQWYKTRMIAVIRTSINAAAFHSWKYLLLLYFSC